MSGRDNRTSLEILLLEYISIIREQSRTQSRIISNFINNNERAALDVNRLLQRYIESLTSNRNTENTTNNYRNYFPNIDNSTDFPPLNTTNSRGTGTWNPPSTRPRSFAQSPLRWPGNSRSRTSQRNTRHRPISFVTPSRMSSRIPTSRTRRRNLLNQILESTLYTPTNRRPASTADISRNVSYHYWRDISNSTDQNLCPITQEEFENNHSNIDAEMQIPTKYWKSQN